MSTPWGIELQHHIVILVILTFIKTSTSLFVTSFSKVLPTTTWTGPSLFSGIGCDLTYLGEITRNNLLFILLERASKELSSECLSNVDAELGGWALILGSSVNNGHAYICFTKIEAGEILIALVSKSEVHFALEALSSLTKPIEVVLDTRWVLRFVDFGEQGEAWNASCFVTILI